MSRIRDQVPSPLSSGGTAVGNAHHPPPVQAWIFIFTTPILLPMVADRVVSIISDLIFLSIICFIYVTLFCILVVG